METMLRVVRGAKDVGWGSSRLRRHAEYRRREVGCGALRFHVQCVGVGRWDWGGGSSGGTAAAAADGMANCRQEVGSRAQAGLLGQLQWSSGCAGGGGFGGLGWM